MTKRIIWPLLLLVTACAVPQANQEKVSAATVTPFVKKVADDLRDVAATLPGAEVGTGEPMTIRYPGQTLFSEGAALPLVGGVERLDPLATLLVGHEASRWQGTVRAATGVSAEYDLQLAETRAALLGRYFSQRGIGNDRLTLQAEAGSGPAFELQQLD